ncbi:MAG: hypothetical protein FJX22_00330 [Alphaproteobacteria bacterium]|nr:hypothetical protein [Alphaproteobacteria bacterium]
MRRNSVVLCLLFLLVSTPCNAQIVEFLEFRGCPSEIHNSYECAKYLEKSVSNNYPSLIIREGDKLSIKILSGKNKIIKDNENEKFSFVEYFSSIQYGLLHIHYYEGDTYDLINMKTGNRTNIGGDAILSPNNKRLAIFNCDISSDFSPNIFKILLITPVGFIEEFNSNTDEWGADKIQWKDNKTILFEAYSWGSDANTIKEKKALRFQGKKIDKKGEWSIESN